VTVELKAWFACEQRLEKRLALDELKIRDVPAFEMQEVESISQRRRGHGTLDDGFDFAHGRREVKSI
jgi:hypothetical protein